MKILFALHENTTTQTNLDFACYIARITSGRLTGVIMETLDHEVIYVSEDPGNRGFHHKMESTDLPDNDPIRMRADALAKRFHEGCNSRETIPVIHRNYGVPLQELVLETRFADLLLLDARTAYPASEIGVPSAFVKQVLSAAECPVLVLPEGHHEVRELIFTYDGQASSVHAIKQFTYLFPQWHNLPVHVMQAVEPHHDIAHKHRLQEWMKDYYEDVRFEFHEQPASDVLMENALGRINAIVVMGAYGRKGLSALFKKSEGDLLLKLLSQPLFIAHR